MSDITTPYEGYRNEAIGTTARTRYRLMVYFAVATMHFYRADIVTILPGETLGDFTERNKSVINKVIKEAVEYFGYELSHAQIGKAIEAYLCDPTKIDPKEAL